MSYLRLFEGFLGRGSSENILDRVLRVINSHVGKPLNSATLKEAQEGVDKIFERSRGYGEKWTLFEGMVITGAHVFAMDGQVSFKWCTAFHPGPRYAGQHGRVDPLGYFGRYDLYMLRQGSLPPIFIARYGEDASDAQCDLIFNIHTHVLEIARDRAKALGMLDASIPDEPVLHGMNFLV